MSQYFSKSYEPFGGDINVKVDLSNYTTKVDIKNISHVDTPSFALKTNLANLKTEVDKLDIDKLVPVPVDLSKLSDVVKNDVVKETPYDKLVAKVSTSRFVLKTKCDIGKLELENKIPDTSGLIKKTDYNAKTTEIEGKIPDVNNLVTKTVLATLLKIKYLILVVLLRKQIITLRLQKLKINLTLIIMINILLPQNLIL